MRDWTKSDASSVGPVCAVCVCDVRDADARCRHKCHRCSSRIEARGAGSLEGWWCCCLGVRARPVQVLNELSPSSCAFENKFKRIVLRKTAFQVSIL